MSPRRGEEGVEEKWREREKERVEGGGVGPRLPCPFSCW